MSAPVVLALPGGAEFRVWPAARYCETAYPDGRTVPAAPHDHDPAYAAKARALGYTGDDPGWAMCRDHELLHSLLAAPAVSPTLWDVACGAGPRPEHYAEEGRVLAAQAALNVVRAAGGQAA